MQPIAPHAWLKRNHPCIAAQLAGGMSTAVLGGKSIHRNAKVETVSRKDRRGSCSADNMVSVGAERLVVRSYGPFRRRTLHVVMVLAVEIAMGPLVALRVRALADAWTADGP
jgi:hypothetical protein